MFAALIRWACLCCGKLRDAQASTSPTRIGGITIAMLRFRSESSHPSSHCGMLLATAAGKSRLRSGRWLSSIFRTRLTVVSHGSTMTRYLQALSARPAACALCLKETSDFHASSSLERSRWRQPSASRSGIASVGLGDRSGSLRPCSCSLGTARRRASGSSYCLASSSLSPPLLHAIRFDATNGGLASHPSQPLGVPSWKTSGAEGRRGGGSGTAGKREAA
mmetsp:Transcript_115690/g.327882  ORF Transcript_115690/g.327882 Transcript_115690/m.327882 type:complete len:221 (-) Transcript_115690:17-679(-)